MKKKSLISQICCDQAEKHLTVLHGTRGSAWREQGSRNSQAESAQGHRGGVTTALRVIYMKLFLTSSILPTVIYLQCRSVPWNRTCPWRMVNSPWRTLFLQGPYRQRHNFQTPLNSSYTATQRGVHTKFQSPTHAVSGAASPTWDAATTEAHWQETPAAWGHSSAVPTLHKPALAVPPPSGVEWQWELWCQLCSCHTPHRPLSATTPTLPHTEDSLAFSLRLLKGSHTPKRKGFFLEESNETLLCWDHASNWWSCSEIGALTQQHPQKKSEVCSSWHLLHQRNHSHVQSTSQCHRVTALLWLPLQLTRQCPPVQVQHLRASHQPLPGPEPLKDTGTSEFSLSGHSHSSSLLLPEQEWHRTDSEANSPCALPKHRHKGGHLNTSPTENICGNSIVLRCMHQGLFLFRVPEKTLLLQQQGSCKESFCKGS